MRFEQLIAQCVCWLAIGWAGQAAAQPTDAPSHEQTLSSSEHQRMRRDLERFSREQPQRGEFEKRRKLLRERARQRFHAADTNRDGVLSREELGRLKPGAVKNFDQLDHNADGGLSEQEVAKALRKQARQRYRRLP